MVSRWILSSGWFSSHNDWEMIITFDTLRVNVLRTTKSHLSKGNHSFLPSTLLIRRYDWFIRKTSHFSFSKPVDVVIFWLQTWRVEVSCALFTGSSPCCKLMRAEWKKVYLYNTNRSDLSDKRTTFGRQGLWRMASIADEQRLIIFRQKLERLLIQENQLMIGHRNRKIWNTNWHITEILENKPITTLCMNLSNISK